MTGGARSFATETESSLERVQRMMESLALTLGEPEPESFGEEPTLFFSRTIRVLRTLNNEA